MKIQFFAYKRANSDGTISRYFSSPETFEYRLNSTSFAQVTCWAVLFLLRRIRWGFLGTHTCCGWSVSTAVVSSLPGTALSTASSAFFSRPWQLEAGPRAGGKDKSSPWPSAWALLALQSSTFILNSSPGLCGWYLVLNISVSANSQGGKTKPCWFLRLRTVLKHMHGVLLLSSVVLVESLYIFSLPKDCWVNTTWLLCYWVQSTMAMGLCPEPASWAAPCLVDFNHWLTHIKGGWNKTD